MKDQAFIDVLRAKAAGARVKPDPKTPALASIVDFYASECLRLADLGQSSYVERYDDAAMAESIRQALDDRGLPVTLTQEGDHAVITVSWADDVKAVR